MTAPIPEIAISAVHYDSRLVSEVISRLGSMLGTVPYWRGHETVGGFGPGMLRESADLAVVLHQRLWGHDEITASDAVELRERMRDQRPVSVVSLDDEPVPEWLAGAASIQSRAASVDEVVARLAEVADTKRAQRLAAPATVTEAGDAPDGRRRYQWDAPIPFLSQPRSQSSLRRAFDDLADELGRQVRTERDRRSDRHAELRCAPHRLVVQLADVGLSFSWVPGPAGTVADGRLLVIEWAGTVVQSRGMGNMRTASPGRERLFQPDATGPDDWCWRAADAGAGAYSSRDLAGQAFAGAMLSLGA